MAIGNAVERGTQVFVYDENGTIRSIPERRRRQVATETVRLLLECLRLSGAI